MFWDREANLVIGAMPRSADAALAELQRLGPSLLIGPRVSIAGWLVAIPLGAAWLFFVEEKTDAVGLAAVAVFAGAFIANDLYRARSGKPSLLLSRDGFEHRTMLGTHSYRWSEIDGVFGRPPVDDDSLGFNLASQREKRSQQWLKGRYDVTMGGFCKPTPELVALLNRRLVLWRIANGIEPEKAITGGS